MNRTLQIAPVRKTILVQAAPERAFEVFTAGIDRWWPKTHGIGAAPIRESIIEPFVGGRWYTTCEDGTEVVVGHVGVWQPPERFVVSWEIGATWKPDARAAFASEVDVRFVADTAGRTRVELEHRNFERMGMAEGETMRNSVDGGWPSILELFANAASTAPRPDGGGRDLQSATP
ncbi:MAG: SRPBCC family protein [Pseudomonadota bacterium]|nr:SRPBCC family protein [Pseudomonadota bacterium]